VPRGNPATAYQSQAVHTASGPALLVMLYDRLAVDIDRAETSIRSGDPNGANSQLQHAQQIVRLLRRSLNSDGFIGGRQLLSLYDFLERHLIEANMTKDATKVRECAALVAPLHQAWRAAVAAGGRADALSHVG
jgi:flagellar secretion chaperone FliS